MEEQEGMTNFQYYCALIDDKSRLERIQELLDGDDIDGAKKEVTRQLKLIDIKMEILKS